mmetsp:Transcript_59566/g.159372  ORF Transcript_59566/g.159372 Transcript_59566/m.159372 type:complete len:230 (+) Transcript_59566:285-974(+)
MFGDPLTNETTVLFVQFVSPLIFRPRQSQARSRLVKTGPILATKSKLQEHFPAPRTGDVEPATVARHQWVHARPRKYPAKQVERRRWHSEIAAGSIAKRGHRGQKAQTGTVHCQVRPPLQSDLWSQSRRWRSSLRRVAPQEALGFRWKHPQNLSSGPADPGSFVLSEKTETQNQLWTTVIVVQLRAPVHGSGDATFPARRLQPQISGVSRSEVLSGIGSNQNKIDIVAV